MEDYHEILYDANPRGVALGNFDGIHKGHQTLLKLLVEKSRNKKILPTVYTFQNHPGTVLDQYNKPIYPYRITPIPLKKRIMEKFGVELLFLDTFTKNLMSLSPSEFAKTILVDTLKAKLVVVGDDFRFGYQASGDIEVLKRLGKLLGFEVMIAPPICQGDMRISSSHIRKFIESGDIESANRLLGHPFMMLNQVEKGYGRGRKMGYPTANLVLEHNQLVPAEGVYATRVNIDGVTYMGATSVGKNPTFRSENVTIETYIIDSNLMLYEREIELYFYKKIRNQITFENATDLKSQIFEDVQSIKSYLQSKKTMIL